MSGVASASLTPETGDNVVSADSGVSTDSGVTGGTLSA
jgi:hypothetical protein